MTLSSEATFTENSFKCQKNVRFVWFSATVKNVDKISSAKCDLLEMKELSGSAMKFRKQRALPVGLIFFGDEASSSLEAGGGFRLPPPRDFWTPLDSFLGLPELEVPGMIRL